MCARKTRAQTARCSLAARVNNEVLAAWSLMTDRLYLCCDPALREAWPQEVALGTTELCVTQNFVRGQAVTPPPLPPALLG